MEDISQSWLSALLLDENSVIAVPSEEQWRVEKNQLPKQRYDEYCHKQHADDIKLSYEDWRAKYNKYIMSYDNWKALPKNSSLGALYAAYIQSCKRENVAPIAYDQWVRNEYDVDWHSECDKLKRYSYEEWFEKFKNDPEIVVPFEQFKMLSEQNEFGETYEEYKTNCNKWAQTYERIKDNYDQIKALMKDAILRNDELGFKLLCAKFKNASWCMRADAGFEHTLEECEIVTEQGTKRSVMSKYVPSMIEFWDCVQEHKNDDVELCKIFKLSATR